MHGMELLLDDFTCLSRAFRVLSSYIRSPAKVLVLSQSAVKLLKVNTPVLVVGGRTVRGPMSLIGEMVARGGREELLGVTPLQRAQISSWVELSHSLPSPTFLSLLTSHLRERSFLIPPSLTLADIIAFSHIEPQLAETQGLKKWTEGIKATPGMAEAIEAAACFYTSLSDPPTPAPSENTAKKAAKPPEKSPKPPPKPPIELFPLLDLRVGRVLRVWKHPERDRIYCQEIDLGNGDIRTIASGLVGMVKEEELTGSLVVVLGNLKARKMGEFVSQGMVLCGGKEGVVEPIRPPEGSKPGDTVTIEGVTAAPLSELPPKKNFWEQTQPHFSISADGEAQFLAYPLRTSAGVVRLPSLRGGSIS